MSFVHRLLRLGTALTSKDFVHQFLDNLWRNLLLFFFEPFIRTFRILSWRILLSVWLIAISFIYIDMCGNLKSKFTDIEYNLVDSLSDLPRDKYGDVAIYKGAVEETFVNKMAEIDDNYRELKKRMRRLDGTDLMDFLVGNLQETRKYLILMEITGKVSVKFIYDYLSEPIPRGKVFFSEPLYSTFVGFAIAANASSRTVRAINDFCELEMETKIMVKYYNEMDFWFFGMKWSKPEDTFQDLTFGDVKSVVDLFFFGCLSSGLIFFVEFSIGLVRHPLKFGD